MYPVFFLVDFRISEPALDIRFPSGGPFPFRFPDKTFLRRYADQQGFPWPEFSLSEGLRGVNAIFRGEEGHGAGNG